MFWKILPQSSGINVNLGPLSLLRLHYRLNTAPQNDCDFDFLHIYMYCKATTDWIRNEDIRA